MPKKKTDTENEIKTETKEKVKANESAKADPGNRTAEGKEIKAVVTAKALNVREAASLKAPVIKIIPEGTVLTALPDLNTPGWLKTPEGYVMSQYTRAADEN